MGWGLPRASAGGGAAQISLSLSTPHSLRSQGFAALCGFAPLFIGSYIRCVCFVEFRVGGGGLTVVADRTWLHRVLFAITMRPEDAENVMIYFPGLTN